jgi:lysophospholipase L1-like esterase
MASSQQSTAVSNLKTIPDTEHWLVMKQKDPKKMRCISKSSENSKQCNSTIHTSNRFLPLETIKENHNETVIGSPTSQCVPQGLEIPTIVNGRISVKNSMKTSKLKILKEFRTKLSPSHKSLKSETCANIRIISDSHLRGMALKLKDNLNSQYKVSSIVKPGAKTKQITLTQDSDLKLLGKTDYLIISAGSNDITANINVNEIIVPLLDFAKQNYHTNIVSVNIPYRYDLANSYISRSINEKITKVNTKLNKLLNTFSHVKIMETSTKRSHFTKHGFHLSYLGKDYVANLISKYIESRILTTRSFLQIEWNNAQSSGIPKETAFNIGSNKHTDCSATANVSTERHSIIGSLNCVEQTTKKTDGSQHSGDTRRTSTREKKNPTTRSSDFLW